MTVQFIARMKREEMIGYQKRLLTVSLLAAAICASCGPSSSVSSDVDVVKNGVLANHNTTTVGKAIEGTFQDPKWTSFQTPKQEVVVQFDGTVAMDALRKSGFGRPYDSLMKPLRDRCISSLGIKEKMEQEAQAAKVSVEEFKRQQAELIERAELTLHKTHPEWSVSELIKTHSDWPVLNVLKGLNIPEETKAMADIEAVRAEQLRAERAVADENESKIKSCQQTIPLPVKFQFILSADKKTFKVQHIDEEAFGGAEPNRILTFVYQ
jgi:hypothetical protein